MAASIGRGHARQIVEELGGVLPYSLNVMDSAGIIIASTDAARVGQPHAAAQRVIREGLPALNVPAGGEDGMKEGVNLPIAVEGEILGVIGITGPLEQVLPYGQIVEKMTRLLVQDLRARDRALDVRRRREEFLSRWLLGAGDAALAKEGLALGVDVGRRWRVAALGCGLPAGAAQADLGSALSGAIEKLGGFYFQLAGQPLALLPMEEDGPLAAKLESLVQDARAEQGLPLLVGVDTPAAGDLLGRVQQARRALDGCTLGEGGVLFYSKADLELLAGQVPPAARREYVHKVLGGLPQEEWPRWVRLLETYFRCEGSLAETSKALFIHKNTLQYQLRKLEHRTGYDVRRLSGGAALYMAVLLYRQLEG